MAAEHYVIVGNGPSANAAALTLRKADQAARITLVSDEPFPYYYRHKLREYVVGGCEESDLSVLGPEHYREWNLRLRLGQRVARLDLDQRTLYLAHMEKVGYTRLLLCLGSVPRIPEVYHAYREYLTVMSTLRHARALRARLAKVGRIVVCGGDMVSFRVASTLARVGKEVTFLLDPEAFWPLELTDERREALARALEAKGVAVRRDDELASVEPADSGGYTVRTKRGEPLLCDLVGAFFGLVPAVGFLSGTGLDLERGILVDEHLATSHPDVFAAGDCAEIYRPEIRNYWVSRGWPNALRLGELAARNMLGESETAGYPQTSVLDVEGIKVDTAWWEEF
jgi:NADPH-dependent 2,4-dienoyl-CoA reductase/sulfur reductase-like enzyme